jgi:hypothetical protein
MLIGMGLASFCTVTEISRMETFNSTDSYSKDDVEIQLNNPNLSHHEQVITKMAGHFSADVTDILLDFDKPEAEAVPRPIQTKTLRISKETWEHREFALISLKRGNNQQAIDYIQRYSPDDLDWIHQQIAARGMKSSTAKPAPIIPKIQIIQKIVNIDPELGRLACVLVEFNYFRAWSYAHQIDDGDGWLGRAEAEAIWKATGIAKDKRQARRLISSGINYGYWTFDRATKRLYLSGQERLAARFVNRIIERDLYPALQTNLPGKWRVETDLSGSLQTAEAALYAAWFDVKVQNGHGTTISRETLSLLWQRSVSTLITWEQVVGIEKEANYAQQNSTALDNVPKHAYLTLNRDGTMAAAWRLPNTYRTNLQARINRRGKAKKIQKAVKVEIALAEQRGSVGIAALPSFTKLYFDEKPDSDEKPFDACEKLLRKIGKEDGDIHRPRYFYVGRRHRVKIFEPYNILSNKQETYLNQRLRKKEKQPRFVTLRDNYRRVLRALP